MDYKKAFEKHEGQNGFIKISSPQPIEGTTKAALNRKGNQLYNSGDIEGARRVFMTTGYSDGLSRIGDYYKSKDRPLEALQMYCLAHDRNKSQGLLEGLANILQAIVKEEQESNE
jgi:hypothetical protein